MYPGNREEPWALLQELPAGLRAVEGISNAARRCAEGLYLPAHRAETPCASLGTHWQSLGVILGDREKPGCRFTTAQRTPLSCSSSCLRKGDITSHSQSRHMCIFHCTLFIFSFWQVSSSPQKGKACKAKLYL